MTANDDTPKPYERDKSEGGGRASMFPQYAKDTFSALLEKVSKETGPAGDNLRHLPANDAIHAYETMGALARLSQGQKISGTEYDRHIRPLVEKTLDALGERDDRVGENLTRNDLLVAMGKIHEYGLVAYGNEPGLATMQQR